MRPPLPIPRIPPPSIEEFSTRYVQGSEPVVITGLVEDWPARRSWSLDYFGERFGDVKAGAFRLLPNGECDVTANRAMTLDISVRDTMASIAEGRIAGGLALGSLADAFPAEVRNDFFAPRYCVDELGLVSRIFIGPAGTLSPLHQDLPENLYVMVRGKKRITMFARGAPVYPARLSKIPNHAHVDPRKPDYARYPELERAQPYELELEAGETLYIPSLWWHHLENLDPSMAVNFWWPTSWRRPIFHAIALYRSGLRRVRALVG